MNKYTLLLLPLLFLVAIFITKNSSAGKQDSVKKNSGFPIAGNLKTVVKDTIKSDKKTYTNSKIGFTFNYPDTWVIKGKEIEIINLSGKITANEIDFEDSISQTTLSIVSNVSDKASELYRFAVSRYDASQGLYSKGGKKIQVAGNDAIEAFTEMRTDGRGNSLNPPMRLIIIDFLDKSQSVEHELQFKTPLTNNDIEVAKFNQLLSTFKFL